MSEHDTTAAHDGGHDTGHGHHDDGGSLGPIGWAMWAVGALGVIAALVVVGGFVIATDFVFLAPGH